MAIRNRLPGVNPVKKFKHRTTAATRIGKSIQDLGEAVTSKTARPAKPKAERKAKGGAQAAKRAPTTAKATKSQERAPGQTGHQDARSDCTARG